MLCTDQDRADQRHLERRGSEIEDESAEDEADASRASVDSLGQRACLPAQVEGQVQTVQVQEDVLGDAPDGALCHFAEHSVAELVEER